MGPFGVFLKYILGSYFHVIAVFCIMKVKTKVKMYVVITALCVPESMVGTLRPSQITKLLLDICITEVG